MPTKEKKPKQAKSPPAEKTPHTRKTAMVKPTPKRPLPPLDISGYDPEALKEIMKQLKIDRAVTVIYVAGDIWTIHLEGDTKHHDVAFIKGVARFTS